MKNFIVNFSFIFVLILLFFSCNEDAIKYKEVSDCEKITNRVEDCMELHRGALGHIKDCGSLELEIVETYESCEEVLDYFGISLLPVN